MSHKIKIFYIDDDALKQLGELLSNETSRSIIKELIEKEYYTNELAKKLDLQTSLVIHHLKKLEELNLVTIRQKQIIKKGVDRRFFRIKSDIFITKTTKETDSKLEGLKKIFSGGIKFTLIGVASIVSYLVSGYDRIMIEKGVSSGEAGSNHVILTTDYPIIIALVVLVLGLVTDRIILFVQNKKRGV